MTPISLVRRALLRGYGSGLSLASYTPAVSLTGLVPGVDNIRQDVSLSPKFCAIARNHLGRLIEQHGQVQTLVRDDSESPLGDTPYGRNHAPLGAVPQPELEHASEFKKTLVELQFASVQRAKQDNNPSVDLLCRLAIIKFLRAELQSQYTQVQERCRLKLTKAEALRTERGSMIMRERFVRFQMQKRDILRKVAQDVFATMREVEKENVWRMRRSQLGEQDAPGYDVLLNRMMFHEHANDAVLNAEHYVMLGNYENDPDRFEMLTQIARDFLRSLGVTADYNGLESLLNVPANAQELLSSDTQERSQTKRAIAASWASTLEREGVLRHVIAAYEVVPLIPEYAPFINPQQLKWALVSKDHQKRLEEVLKQHPGFSAERIEKIARSVRSASKEDRIRYATRFMIDLLRYHRDRSRLQALNAALDGVHVVATERVRELSRVNETLYEFLLPPEQKPPEQRVLSHVVLKADIRDSTNLTRTLMERGLNPASFFSLNFYEPVNRLLPKYGATKVFIEGDALILALFEREGEPQFSVARTCILAREIIDIVSAYNEESMRSGLPTLDLGIGIAFQDSAPLYLVDGTHRVMISKALNESDRLSGCHKRARKQLEKHESPFHVFAFQTISEDDAAGALEDFLLCYNVGGIHLPRNAFQKLREEISLHEEESEALLPWGREKVKLYRGLVPVSDGVFHPIVIREGRAAQVNVRDFGFIRWADHVFYEICVDPLKYED